MDDLIGRTFGGYELKEMVGQDPGMVRKALRSAHNRAVGKARS